jgi:hypothetical protein
LIESLHYDIQSTGQKSQTELSHLVLAVCFVLIKQSNSPRFLQFSIYSLMHSVQDFQFPLVLA